MDKKQLHSALQRWANNEIPPESIDLWPGVQENLHAREQHRSSYGEKTMFAKTLISTRMKWAIPCGVALILLFTFLAVTPTGKGLAQAALRFFMRSEQNSGALPTIEVVLQEQPAEQVSVPSGEGDAAAASPAGCGTILLPRCTVEEAQANVTFPIRLPEELPADMSFSGAVPMPGGVLLRFEGQRGVLLLAESITGEALDRVWTIGADASVEMVMVGDQPAEHVQGGWSGSGIQEESLPWDENLPTRTLRWQTDGLQYSLVNFPQRSADGPLGLSLEQMQALAASLSPRREELAAADTSGEMTLQQAQESAGFDFVPPSWLPPALRLSKITYGSQYNAICQYYQTSEQDVAPTLVVAQSTWELPQVSELQDKANFDGKPVEIALTQEFFPVQGADGGQGVFAESGLQPSAFCGSEAASANRALLWQQGERTNILFAQLDANDGRGFVTRQEMQRIAEAINGVELEAEPARDPERLLSLQDAEALTGLDLKLPGLMLEAVRFDHIAYRRDVDQAGYASAYYAGAPLGDGRTYNVLVIQTPASQATLEQLRLAGGYEPVTVRGEAGIYQAQCYDATSLAGGLECRQFLTWFEDGTQYDLSTFFPALVPEEKIFAIAESMR